VLTRWRAWLQVVINSELRQVEMWLVAQSACGPLPGGACIRAGERVLAEVSRKYTPASLRAMAYNSGFVTQVRAASSRRGPTAGCWGTQFFRVFFKCAQRPAAGVLQPVLGHTSQEDNGARRPAAPRIRLLQHFFFEEKRFLGAPQPLGSTF
jgi:hypothetical protein